jgi:hypothetical protein
MKPHTIEELESDFRAELADADQWYAHLREQEMTWIREGKDADVEFDRLYTEEPRALGAHPEDDWKVVAAALAISVGVVLSLGAAILWWKMRSNRRRQELQEDD